MYLCVYIDAYTDGYAHSLRNLNNKHSCFVCCDEQRAYVLMLAFTMEETMRVHDIHTHHYPAYVYLLSSVLHVSREEIQMTVRISHACMLHGWFCEISNARCPSHTHGACTFRRRTQICTYSHGNVNIKL